ncbi:MAG: hypothetical protein A2V70_15595 [Planctomycetes bacterium RBG_13_63_9]|nr:MAG: hypothetical protein A2V70_15595 [Planctomycetes bacterium RBG_13_63_9]
MGLLAGAAPLCAAEMERVLAVPVSPTTLHLAIPLPAAVQPQVAGTCQLVEIDRPDVALPAQRVTASAADGSAAGKDRRLLAEIPPRDGAGPLRRFRIEPAETTTPEVTATDAGHRFQFEDVDDKSLKLTDAGEPVLVYNHGLITDEQIPQRDSRRSRACYIHPLWGISGEVLTDDFPRDHYHHHGIFWNWPHVGIEGHQYNFWDGDQIRDKFVAWICRESGPLGAVLAVENGWFIGQRKVMIERVWLRVFGVSDQTRSLDVEFTWIPVDRPITLQGAEGKSYGGLTVRFDVKRATDAVIITPEGRGTDDLKEMPLAWVDLTYPFDPASGLSGAAVFVHPGHPDYPPTWLTRHYGPLCVGWPGIEAKTFEPGKPIRLDYRIWIHKTAVEPDQLRRAYDGYTTATRATWE